MHAITRKITFLAINPINIDEEKEKVMKDSDYNPYFKYSSQNYDLDLIEEELNSVEDHESILGDIIKEKKEYFIDKCEMLKAIGTPRFNIFSKKVYGFPQKTTLEKSAEFLSIKSQEEEKTLNSSQTVNRLQAEINHYGFDYSVSERDMSASAAVLVGQKKIFIKNNKTFSENFVKRLTIHEIGTHVLRAENGRRQPFALFISGFPKYLATEEGLAVVNEERFNLLNNANLKNYAGRAIGVKMAHENSFSELYQFLLKYFEPNTAFRLTLRVKRGICDTSKKGGCTKDYVYIEGYFRVKEFLKTNSINKLYWGKIGLEHVDLIKDIPGLNPPKFLPKNQTFKNLFSF